MSSLTNFLKSNEASTFVDAFSTYISNNKKEIILTGETRKNIKKYSLLKDYAIVGTAYDYLLRIRIALLNNINMTANDTVAAISLTSLVKFHAHEAELIFLVKFLLSEFNALMIVLRKMYDSNTKLTQAHFEQLINLSIQLAIIDRIYRQGELISVEDLSLKYIEKYKHDLITLWKNTEMSLFESKLKCFSLNPTIGSFNVYSPNSGLITKSDGDLVIDDRIIDIKTTNSMDYSNFIQVFCYAIMINHKFNTQIDTIQLYFSRYNRLASLCINSEPFHEFREQFIKCSQKKEK